MSPVFLDTVGLLAVWNEDDQWHDAASTAFTAVKRERATLFTTTFVLAECANATARSAFRESVVDLRMLLGSYRGLIHPTEADFETAWEHYKSGFPGAPGLVDELSFSVMRRLGLRRAFTNDRHFTDAGFEALF